MKPLAILFSCLLLAIGAGVSAAPSEVPWDITTTTIWADTLPGRFTGDSAAYSQPINVFGARAIVIDAQTSGSAYPTDTLSIGEPIMDVVGRDVYTTYPGGGLAKAMPGWEVACGGVINPEGTQIYRFYAGTTAVQGGTPVPLSTRYIKFKMKSGNTRKFLGASLTNLQAVGTITVRAHVIR